MVMATISCISGLLGFYISVFIYQAPCFKILLHSAHIASSYYDKSDHRTLPCDEYDFTNNIINYHHFQIQKIKVIPDAFRLDRQQATTLHHLPGLGNLAEDFLHVSSSIS